jgi:hypothetical protein
MPIPWLAVLQSVPWTDVLKNAPKVSEGAKKLWSSVGKKAPMQEQPAESAEQSPSHESQTIAMLQARLAETELATTELHNQMLASSELIKTLADQNTQLIGRIEATRLRVVWLAGATAVFGVIAVLCLALVLVR